MILFFRLSAIYAIASFALVAGLRGFDNDFLQAAVIAAVVDALTMTGVLRWVLPLAAIIVLCVGLRKCIRHLPLVLMAIVTTIIFQAAFSFMKSSIPLIVPFYADTVLAEVDRILHFGVDPWRLVYSLLEGVPPLWVLNTYFFVWSFPAMGAIALLAMFDRNEARVERYALLYLICWVGLGNVVAVVGSSVGPMFYDTLLGQARFADFQAAFAAAGLNETRLNFINGYLWHNYADEAAGVGSGISAFPSVHVGVATLTMLYLAERSRHLLLPGVAFLVVILLLSVYTGYHYAIDGYFSIAFMIVARQLVVKWQERRARQAGRRADMPVIGDLAADGP